MFTRKLIRIPSIAVLFALVLAAPGRSADAQSTGDVVACVEKAADDLVKCTDSLPWYYEALCYARYAADGILCGPSLLLKKV